MVLKDVQGQPLGGLPPDYCRCDAPKHPSMMNIIN